MRYQSPSLGPLEFAWRGPLLHRGREIPLGGFPRLASPWGGGEFPLQELVLQAGGATHRLPR